MAKGHDHVILRALETHSKAMAPYDIEVESSMVTGLKCVV